MLLNKTEKSEARDDSVFRVDREKDLRLAGPTDLVKLLPAPGCNPLILPKWVVETMVYSIAHYEMCHLSGPSGGAKSSLQEALARRPENFNYICKNMGYEPKPLWLFPVEMAIFESPGELFQRRSLKDGSTYDEKSILVCALGEAAKLADRYYPLIWLREIGRVHSAMVQGGLLNLMSKAEVTLPDGKLLDASRIAWGRRFQLPGRKRFNPHAGHPGRCPQAAVQRASDHGLSQCGSGSACFAPFVQ